MNIKLGFQIFVINNEGGISCTGKIVCPNGKKFLLRNNCRTTINKNSLKVMRISSRKGDANLCRKPKTRKH